MPCKKPLDRMPPSLQHPAKLGADRSNCSRCTFTRKGDVMRRWGWLGILWGTALAVVATIPMDVTAQQCPKGKLRIYTSWPMQGAMIPEGTGMKNGVDLAVPSEIGRAHV